MPNSPNALLLTVLAAALLAGAAHPEAARAQTLPQAAPPTTETQDIEKLVRERKYDDALKAGPVIVPSALGL